MILQVLPFQRTGLAVITMLRVPQLALRYIFWNLRPWRRSF